MTETKEQILERMIDVIPYKIADEIKPYILECMQVHTNQQLILHGVIPMLLCVDDCGVKNRLSEGKKYEIEADNDETYTIYDDLGTMNLFNKERFKVVP